MAKSVSTGNPYENLANAIILTAVEVEKLERFFRSGWYSVLTSVDGDFLIRKMRAEYDI